MAGVPAGRGVPDAGRVAGVLQADAGLLLPHYAGGSDERPDATHVAGFNKWRDQFGRNVLKGEKGIRIIAPTPYKKKVEEIKTDPETNAPILDADGKAIIEEKEIRIPMFKVVPIFRHGNWAF